MQYEKRLISIFTPSVLTDLTCLPPIDQKELAKTRLEMKKGERGPRSVRGKILCFPQLCPCSAMLCTSFVPSLNYILIIETIRMTKSHISSLAHTRVSLKASLLPQHLTPKQFTCVMDTREVLVFSVTAAGFSPNSWCLWL